MLVWKGKDRAAHAAYASRRKKGSLKLRGHQYLSCEAVFRLPFLADAVLLFCQQAGGTLVFAEFFHFVQQTHNQPEGGDACVKVAADALGAADAGELETAELRMFGAAADADDVFVYQFKQPFAAAAAGGDDFVKGEGDIGCHDSVLSYARLPKWAASCSHALRSASFSAGGTLMRRLR